MHYPVAIDNDFATWNAYSNEYWPAEYLIDAQGNVRHVDFGEGDYATTEQLIRQLLTAAHPGVALPPRRTCPNLTPAGQMNPETYLGYEQLQYLDPAGPIARNAPAVYRFPASLPLGALGLAGTWALHAQEATAGPGAELELGFLAKDIYLVLGGHGTVDVSVDGRHLADGQGQHGAEALHAVPGGHHPQRHTAPAGLARRAGLRLHVRLTSVAEFGAAAGHVLLQLGLGSRRPAAAARTPPASSRRSRRPGRWRPWPPRRSQRS